MTKRLWTVVILLSFLCGTKAQHEEELMHVHGNVYLFQPGSNIIHVKGGEDLRFGVFANKAEAQKAALEIRNIASDYAGDGLIIQDRVYKYCKENYMIHMLQRNGMFKANCLPGMCLLFVEMTNFKTKMVEIKKGQTNYKNIGIETWLPPIEYLGGDNDLCCHPEYNNKKYKYTGQYPRFPGHRNAFSYYLESSLKYPTVALENDIFGTVKASFSVDKDGTVNNIMIEQSVDPALDKEVIRTLKIMPQWQTAKRNKKRQEVIVDFRIVDGTIKEGIANNYILDKYGKDDLIDIPHIVVEHLREPTQILEYPEGSSSDFTENFYMGVIRTVLKRGIATEKTRVVIRPYLVDCQDETTIAYDAIYYDGKKYHQKKNKKDFRYKTGRQMPKADKVFEVDTVVKMNIPPQYMGRHLTLHYTVSVEDYSKPVYKDSIVGSCLVIRPFKFVQLPTQDMALTEEFMDMTAPDLYQQFCQAKDETRLNELIDSAYWEIIKEKDYAENNAMAPYVCNLYAVKQIKRGTPNVEILRPFIDFSRYGNGRSGIDVKRWTSSRGTIPWNKHEIVFNQAVAYYLEGKRDTAYFLNKWLKSSEKCMAETGKINDLDRLKVLLFRSKYYCDYDSNKDDEYRRVLKSVLDICDDNKAVLYTEIKELLKQDEAMEWVDKMDNSNPKKWYLKAILMANGYNEETKFWKDKELSEEYWLLSDIPIYLVYLHHCFSMAPEYKEYYKFDAQFSDEQRKETPYKDDESELYEKIFKMLNME